LRSPAAMTDMLRVLRGVLVARVEKAGLNNEVVAPAAVPTPAVSHASPALSNEHTAHLTSDTTTGLPLPPPPATKTEPCGAGEPDRQISTRTGMAWMQRRWWASSPTPVSFRCQSAVVTIAVCT
jgi:hypothetical protein